MIPRPPLRLPAPRPATGRAGRPSSPGRRRWVAPVIAAGVAAGLTAGVVAGCGPSAPSKPPVAPSPTPPPAALPGAPAGPTLLLLATVTEAPVLGMMRPAAGITALPLPGPSTMAVTPMGNGSLVALLADSGAFVAPEGLPGLLAGAGWRRLDLRWSGAPPAEAIIFAAATSPGGERLAAIARPPFAESPSALVVVEPLEGRAEAVALPDESVGATPAWLDDDRVAIVQRDRDGETFVSIIAIATGRVVDRIPFRALAFGTSGDGQVSVILGHESRLFVGATAGVLARRRAPDDGPDLAPGDVVRGSVALDSDGRRLAAVVEDAAGISRIATFVRAGDAWEPGARIAAPPGSYGGRLAWLP